MDNQTVGHFGMKEAALVGGLIVLSDSTRNNN
jgi:hypothetical protein